MPKDIAKFQRVIFAALDVAFHRALEQERVAGKRVLDTRNAKFVIFSDHHKGSRDGADDFLVCERAYNAALAYYDRLQYTLAVLGDVEELWEDWPETVVKAYSHTLELESKFHQDGRYLRFWGNHDDAWSHPDVVEKWLTPALGRPIQVLESLLLHVCEGEEELGVFFLVHGHQGTFSSEERIVPFSKFALRYLWRPIQRLLRISVNTPAKDFVLRYAHDSAMYAWSESKKNVVLIAGHTHRPVFKSESREDIIRKALAEAELKLAKRPDNLKLQKQIAELAAELEWTLAQNQQSPKDIPIIEFKKPSYFNTGCCAFLDGDITGLEFSEGEIRLVRWPDDEDTPKPQVLARAPLKDVFAAC
ncbi:MAG TPA: metallophosphoesterase [Anaerolineales bacterium]|nr:metallophosphoesterase [Anaerolineales bacterium]